jgi:hypothetical protein
MQNAGYDSSHSDDEPVYIPPKTRRKKFRKSKIRQNYIKQLINKTKKLKLSAQEF